MKNIQERKQRKIYRRYYNNKDEKNEENKIKKRRESIGRKKYSRLIWHSGKYDTQTTPTDKLILSADVSFDKGKANYSP